MLLLKICGITEAQMPKLFESYEVIGKVKPDIAAQLGIPESVQVVAGAGDNDGFPFIAFVLQMLQRFGGEIAKSVTRGLRAGQRTTESQPLAGDDTTLKAIDNTLILSIHICDLAPADTDITGGCVCKLTDMTV